jgi:hypothetical protein
MCPRCKSTKLRAKQLTFRERILVLFTITKRSAAWTATTDSAHRIDAESRARPQRLLGSLIPR